MTREEAKEVLKFHSYTHENIDHPKMENGFLGMLRPFSGDLFDENYYEVMGALRVLAGDLRNNEKIDKDVISAVWSICHLSRMWALDPNGMLQANHLIRTDQIKKLESWITKISYAMMLLLDGVDEKTVFESFDV